MRIVCGPPYSDYWRDGGQWVVVAEWHGDIPTEQVVFDPGAGNDPFYNLHMCRQFVLDNQ